MSWPWSELGLSGPASPEEIKHAYAQRLKDIHPEENPDGFQRLHRAYQVARRLTQTSISHPQQGDSQPHSGFSSFQAESTSASPDLASQETNEGSSAADDDSIESSHSQTPHWDFDTLLSQEPEPEEDISEEESAWVAPVYRTQSPRRLRLTDSQKAIVLIAVMFIIAIILNWPVVSPNDTASKAAATQTWLENTFQIPLVSSSGNKDREEDRFLYWSKEDPDIRFQAILEEDGSIHTNYTNAVLFHEMKAFSQAWPEYPLWFDLEMTDSTGEGAEGGSPPYLFLFQVPLEGAEEFLSALGEQLEQVAHTDWYIQQPPEYLVALAHGEAILCSYDSTDQEMPSRKELLTLYQEELCSPLLEDLLFQQDVVLWDYPDDKNLVWVDSGPGWVLDENGWWISCRGTGREGRDLTMYYFLRDDYAAVYCVPAEVLDEPETMITLSCMETRTMPCGHEVEIYRIL